MSSLAFLRATVLTPLERVEDAALILRGGTIAWVGPRGAAPAGLLGSVPQAELPGDLILPGLIDLHLNGAGSIDLREADPPGVLSLARSLAEGGTTAFLPTLISSPHGCLLRALGALAQAAERQRQGPGKGARILGVHLEGPYLNPAMRGAHPAEALRPASRQEVEEYLRAAGATAHPGGTPSSEPPSSAGAQQNRPYRSGPVAGATAHPGAAGSLEPPSPAGAPTERDSRSGPARLTSMSSVESSSPKSVAEAGLRMVTLAPEVEGALPLIRELAGRGVVVALGHTAASFEQTREAIAAGARHAVHAFNRYEPLHHRRPGALSAILEDERVSLELIADGVHLHPSTVRFLYRARAGRGLVLVSDLVAWEKPPGSAEGERGAIFRRDTLAGGATSLFEGVRNLSRWCGLSLGAAAAHASLEPAAVLGLGSRLGALAPGAEADLLVVDRESEELRGAMVGGSWVLRPAGLP